MEYLYSTANLFASVWQVEGIRDRDQFQSVVDELKLDQPMWEPSREKLDLGDGDNEEAVSVEDDDKLKTELSRIDTTKLQPAKPQEFEKDGMRLCFLITTSVASLTYKLVNIHIVTDDLNFHIDFLTAATNMRSWNYDIKASARHAVKVTAGRIIPALATTTAMVCGLVMVEFCKLSLGLQSQGRDKFLNSNVSAHSFIMSAAIASFLYVISFRQIDKFGNRKQKFYNLFPGPSHPHCDRVEIASAGVIHLVG